MSLITVGISVKWTLFALNRKMLRLKSSFYPANDYVKTYVLKMYIKSHKNRIYEFCFTAN